MREGQDRVFHPQPKITDATWKLNAMPLLLHPLADLQHSSTVAAQFATIDYFAPDDSTTSVA